MKPAIVLASHTMGLGVIRSLGRMGVPVTVVYYDDRDVGYLSRYVTERIRAPHPEKEEQQFIQLLMELSPRQDGGLIIPTSDATVASVSRHKGRLEERFVVACADWETARRFLDKKHTYELARMAGVPVPATVIPQTEEDVVLYAKEIQYPCLVKPRQSHQYYAVFHTKMVLVHSLDEMLGACRSAWEAGFQVMLQEYIPGPDSNGANYNAYFWDDQPLVEFTAQKLRNAPSGLGSPRVAVSKSLPEVVEKGRKTLRAIGYNGYACTEFKLDPRDGQYKLMEVNGRHNLSTLLAVRCGINFPWVQYRHLILGARPEPMGFEEGIYWIDLARDLAYSARSLRREHFSPWEYLRPYVSTHVFAILDARDPKPFLRKCFLLSKAL